ncbi:class I SAM-dependent methyltransferase [Dethiosulfatarculus sandiegensis]|uniref:O-methyltransferase n=1 Tax=Dethiosulfatarculus sandiegensis TaxID=1429043 RepID=A0A0D2J157_9BACT|nr:class I SAM-dependent methyltransferase [Dethiosulfatarculus sandiegensis]KIX11949.1 hypothetical protein X474_21705 [Dethiosulfatarculus sandiegensis]
MTGMPRPDQDCEPLFSIFTDLTAGKLLIVAIDLDLFNLLHKPMTVQEVSQALESHQSNTRLFLDALVAVDLLKRQGPHYQNSRLSDLYLTDDSPYAIGKMLRQSYDEQTKYLDHLEDLVKTGNSALRFSGQSMDQPEIWRDMVKGMGNYSRSSVAQDLAAVIKRQKRFPQLNKVLDLGGAHGVMALELLLNHPNLQAVIMDRPEVLEGAKGFIAEYGLQDRVSLRGGDYVTDDLGEGYDLVLACSTLHFHYEFLTDLLKKIHASLKPKGILAALNAGLTEEGCAPREIVLTMLPWRLAERSNCLDQGEIADAAFLAGFRSVRSMTIKTPGGPMELDIARK